MEIWQLIFAIVPGLALFLYGIESFSKEIENIAGENFKRIIQRATDNPLGGTFLGAIVTAVIQSSSATTTITVGLVNAGILSFTQSLGIIFGANIGTTITAQLVALKLTFIAPLFIGVGFALDLFSKKHKVLGKTIFYFGLVFFGLNLISSAVAPIKNDPQIMELFLRLDNVFLGLAAGIILTTIVQSSSVTTGLVVLLAGEGLISLGSALPILLGANIGSTTTSLFAASSMDLYSKRAAAAHTLFNLFGAVLFLPFLPAFASAIASLGGEPARQVANAHLAFNFVCAAIFLVFLPQFRRLVVLAVPGEDEQIILKTRNLKENYSDIGALLSDSWLEIRHSFEVSKKAFDYAILCSKSVDSAKANRVRRLEQLSDFLNERINNAILSFSKETEGALSEREAELLIFTTRISNGVENFADEAVNILETAERAQFAGASMSEEAIKELDSIYSVFGENLGILISSEDFSGKVRLKIKKNDWILRERISASYLKQLKRISGKGSKDLLVSRKAHAGSGFIETLSTIESANSRLGELRRISVQYTRLKGMRASK